MKQLIFTITLYLIANEYFLIDDDLVIIIASNVVFYYIVGFTSLMLSNLFSTIGSEESDMFTRTFHANEHEIKGSLQAFESNFQSLSSSITILEYISEMHLKYSKGATLLNQKAPQKIGADLLISFKLPEEKTQQIE